MLGRLSLLPACARFQTVFTIFCEFNMARFATVLRFFPQHYIEGLFCEYSREPLLDEALFVKRYLRTFKGIKGYFKAVKAEAC